MRALVIAVLLAVTACGKGGENWECDVDADCDKGLMCGTLQTPDGSKRAMCVKPDGVWNMAGEPKTYKRYIMPVAIGAGVLVLLLMLRSSVVARDKRRRAKPPA